MTRRSDAGHSLENRWRHEETFAVDSSTAPREVDRAWWELLRAHMPYHILPGSEYDALLGRLREIEMQFLTATGGELVGYYDEAFLGRASAAEPGVDGNVDSRIRHIAVLQAELMEQVYFTLRLDRYANAPDNRGWMNLFRRWGRSRTFNRHFDPIRTILSADFVQFYDHYLKDVPYDIDTIPIPHPWDVQPADMGGSTAYAPFIRWKRVPGVFLDSGLVEAGSPTQSIAPADESRTGDASKSSPIEESTSQ